MGGEARGSKPNNSELNYMDRVSGAQLAYAAVQVCIKYIDVLVSLRVAIQARFGISSKNRWSEMDGIFNYRKFYYALIELVDDNENVEWRDDLLKYYNMCVFIFEILQLF